VYTGKNMINNIEITINGDEYEKIVMTLVLSMIVLVLVGCSNNVPSDDKILSNMNESEIVNVKIGNELKKLKVTSIDVKKDNKEDKSYTVYCTAKQADEKYECTADYVLYYNLYDKGGWILDKFDIENKKLNSLIAVPEEALKETLSEQGYSDVELVSIDKYNKNTKVYNSRYKARTSYPYITQINNISMQSEFGDSSWVTAPLSNDESQEWSSMYGNWLGTPNEESKTYINIDIKSIDTEKGIINYSYDFYVSGKASEDFKYKLYTKNMTSELKKYDNIYDYDFETQFTCENETTDVTIAIGKNKGLRVHANNGITYIMTKK
jgi:hypothetical protein